MRSSSKPIDPSAWLSLITLSPTLLAQADSVCRFKTPRHIEALNSHLLAMERGELGRLAVFMPPRHGKSHLCSTYFPAWFILRNPRSRIILASYEAEFAARWGRRTLGVVKRWGAAFGVRVTKDAANSWETSHGGGMDTAGVGGAITGKGADLLIIDDPVKNAEEAASETYRDRAWDWYMSTARTRLEPGGRILLIQTRWHEDDLAGKVLRNTAHENWEVLSFPALAEDNDVLGRRVGEPLWPARFDAKALAAIRDTPTGAYWWAAMYQQRPAPIGGGMVKREWFKHYDALNGERSHMRIFVSVDLAFREKASADFTAALVWGLDQKTKALYLLDGFHGQRDAPDVVRELHRLETKWHPEAFWVERVGAQVAAIQYMRLSGLPVREIKPMNDKAARLSGALPYLEAGKILFPRMSLLTSSLELELLAFPNAAHDDLDDAFAYGTTVGMREIAHRGPRQVV